MQKQGSRKEKQHYLVLFVMVLQNNLSLSSLFGMGTRSSFKDQGIILFILIPRPIDNLFYQIYF